MIKGTPLNINKLILCILVYIISTFTSITSKAYEENHSIKLLKKYNIYKASGKSHVQIDESFVNKEKGINIGGFDAEILYNYKFNIDSENCSTNDFTLEINYTLPQLSLEIEDQHLGESYREYLSNLYRHEEIHCAISLEAIVQIKNIANQGKKSQSRCLRSISKIALIEDSFPMIHIEFDNVTNHGEFPEKSNLGQSAYIKKCKIEHKPIIYY